MATKAKIVEGIRAVVNDLMLADYDDYSLPAPVAKAVNDLMSLLPAIKKEDDDGEGN